MKKVNLIINIVLVLAVAALFVLHFTGNGKASQTPVSGNESVTASKGDIVYILSTSMTCTMTSAPSCRASSVR